MQGSHIVPPSSCKTDCDHCSYRCEIKLAPMPTVVKAMNTWLKKVSVPLDSVEVVPLVDALGRITAEETFAFFDVPRTNCAAHDGIAVRYQDCVALFAKGQSRLKKGQYRYCPMGAVLPEEFDSLAHAEKCSLEEDGSAVLYEIPVEFQSVKLKGSSVKEGELVVPAGRQLTPSDLAILQYVGHTTIKVKMKPVISIIPVGNDLVEPGNVPGPGQYVDCDSIYIASFVRDCGAKAVIYSIIPDDDDKIVSALSTARAASDIVVLIGGISRGSTGYGDHTLHSANKVCEIIYSGIKLEPGGFHMMVGVMGGKPVLGIPGPPHAAITMVEYFLPPVIDLFLGGKCHSPESVDAILEHDFPPRGGGENIWVPRLRLTKKAEGNYTARIVEQAGDTVCNFSLADAFVPVTGDRENFQKGCRITAYLLRPKWSIK